jgi:hypothetical protein
VRWFSSIGLRISMQGSKRRGETPPGASQLPASYARQASLVPSTDYLLEESR